MKRVNIDNMKVSISFEGENANSDVLYCILSNVIKRLENEDKTDEKKCSVA